MATFSTHILNSVNGTHFSNIDVKLFKCTKTEKNELIFHEKTDIGGRLKVSFDLNSEIVSDYEVQVFLPNDFNNNTTIETIKKNINILDTSIGQGGDLNRYSNHKNIFKYWKYNYLIYA